MTGAWGVIGDTNRLTILKPRHVLVRIHLRRISDAMDCKRLKPFAFLWVGDGVFEKRWGSSAVDRV